jgi:REP element-mobilizing transposase RayT
MDRFWFLTWTTYGTWLPGDARGFVSPVWDHESERLVIHNELGTDYDRDLPILKASAEKLLKCDPIHLTREQATAVATQLAETATYRGWRLFAYAIMWNHVHVCLGVPGDPDAENLLRDCKAYASRALNHRWGKPASGTWWTRSGSKRKVRPTEEDIASVVKYIQYQEAALVMWTWLMGNAGKPAS